MGDSPNKDLVEVFLESSKAADTSEKAVATLFVWIEGSTGRCRCGESLPERYESAIAFLGTQPPQAAPEEEKSASDGDASTPSSTPSSPAPVSAPTKQQFLWQCVTLQPSVPSLPQAGETKEADNDNGNDNGNDKGFGTPVEAPSSQATLLSALQLYTKHLFLPAISSASNAFCLMAGILDLLLVLGCSGKPREHVLPFMSSRGPCSSSRLAP